MLSVANLSSDITIDTITFPVVILVNSLTVASAIEIIDRIITADEFIKSWTAIDQPFHWTAKSKIYSWNGKTLYLHFDAKDAH